MMGAERCGGQRSVFVSLAPYSEGEKRLFYLDLARVGQLTDVYGGAVVESIGSPALEKRRGVLMAYVQAYEEEIGSEFVERTYTFLVDK